jgi:CRP/FNR family transcriptional regulator, anaerobic regulatory protein
VFLKNAKCLDCGLHKICLSRGLNGDELKCFDQIVSSNLKFQSQIQLYRQGDQFQGLYAIKSGSTKSFIVSADGSEQIVGFQFPGDILGLDSFERRLYSSSVIFLEDSVVCYFPYDRFNLLCDQIPHLLHVLLSHASQENTHDHEMLMTINQKTAEERIAFFLIEITHRLHLDERTEATFHLPMQRKDIGNYLGVTQETVSRIFTKFERDGLITVSGKNLQIIDPHRLEQFVSFCNCCPAVI